MSKMNVLLENATAIGAGPRIDAGDPASVHVWGSTTSGTGSATVVIEVSNADGAPYITAGTVTLSLNTTGVADGFHIAAEWRYVRARVTAITGTGASVNCNFGV